MCILFLIYSSQQLKMTTLNALCPLNNYCDKLITDRRVLHSDYYTFYFRSKILNNEKKMQRDLVQ